MGGLRLDPEIEPEAAMRQDTEENRQRDECRERPSPDVPRSDALHDFLLRHLRRSSECQHDPCQLRAQGDQGLARKLIVRFRTLAVRERAE